MVVIDIGILFVLFNLNSYSCVVHKISYFGWGGGWSELWPFSVFDEVLFASLLSLVSLALVALLAGAAVVLLVVGVGAAAGVVIWAACTQCKTYKHQAIDKSYTCLEGLIMTITFDIFNAIYKRIHVDYRYQYY